MSAPPRQGGRAVGGAGDDASLDLQRDLPRSAMLASPMDEGIAVNYGLLDALLDDG